MPKDKGGRDQDKAQLHTVRLCGQMGITGCEGRSDQTVARRGFGEVHSEAGALNTSREVLVQK